MKECKNKLLCFVSFFAKFQNPLCVSTMSFDFIQICFDASFLG